jgi:hypothetical protein
LFHGGREVIASAPRPVVVSSSALPSHRYHTEPRALATVEVESLIDAYATSAAAAAEAGLDGVEVTAAHGYLAEQFFDATLNTRSDRFREPERFLLEVLGAVRRAAPRITLGVRLSADSAAARAVAPRLHAAVDYVHVAMGNSATFDGCVNIVPPPPMPQNVIAELTQPFRDSVPVIATTRIVDPAAAERLIAAGVADAVGMNRALITDPDMPSKARSGAAEAIIRCIGCNACIAHYHAETPIRCAQNPRTGRERAFPIARRTASETRTVIVGAGPAGLAAAREALDLGHRVVMFERATHAGGQAWLAGQTPAGRELYAAFEANYEGVLSDARLTVHWSTTADADAVRAASPARVVLATGARPYQPSHPLTGVAVVQAWDVLAGNRPSGRIVVADWGRDSIGLDCAEVLAAAGADVTLMIGAIYPGQSLHQYHRNSYIGRLCRAGVRIEHYQGLASAADGAVYFRNVCAPELETTIVAETLVLCLGRVPCDDLATALGDSSVSINQVGDCLSPRGLEEAILEGTLAMHDPVPAPA